LCKPHRPAERSAVQVGRLSSVIATTRRGGDKWMSAFDYKGRRCGERPGVSPEDQRDFGRWLIADAILCLIIAGGVLAMALAGLDSVNDLIRR